MEARSAGNSEKGGTSRRKDLERRTTATFWRRRASRSTTALMKWVVPTVTLAMREGRMEPDSMTARMAAVMPEVASGVVGVFFRLIMPRFGSPWAARATSMATASVFVPGLV